MDMRQIVGYAAGVRSGVLMAKPKHTDTRYLELKNGKYRVTVAVRARFTRSSERSSRSH